jgi:hypothetical protein
MSSCSLGKKDVDGRDKPVMTPEKWFNNIGTRSSLRSCIVQKKVAREYAAAATQRGGMP